MIDPRVSTWVSTDPALDKYLPTGEQNVLKGRGGTFRSSNLNAYLYGALNPLKFTDPNGMWIDEGDGTFRAEKGDTLYKLQEQTGLSWQETNFKGNPRHLQIGQRVSYKVHNSLSNTTVDSTISAIEHYFHGGGEPANMGANTVTALKNHPDQKIREERIRTGLTSRLSGNYAINMEPYVFHVGKTRVDYLTTCGTKFCITKFSGFTQDGFWDPLSSLKWLGVPEDGPGPQSELPGGKTYPYVPYHWIMSFPKPR